MTSLKSKVRRFIVSDDGPTAVEYAVMLAMIVLVCIGAVRAVGVSTNATFETLAPELG